MATDDLGSLQVYMGIGWGQGFMFETLCDPWGTKRFVEQDAMLTTGHIRCVTWTEQELGGYWRLRYKGFITGFKFCQKPSRINLLKALSDIHRVTPRGGQQNSDGDQLRGVLWSTALNVQSGQHSFPLRFREALDFLKKQISWIIMPSDKSGGVVIINKLEYISAAEDMLADGNVYKLLSNPLTYMIGAFNQNLMSIVDAVDQGNGALN